LRKKKYKANNIQVCKEEVLQKGMGRKKEMEDGPAKIILKGGKLCQGEGASKEEMQGTSFFSIMLKLRKEGEQGDSGIWQNQLPEQKEETGSVNENCSSGSENGNWRKKCPETKPRKD